MVVDDEEGPRQSLRMVFRQEFNVQTFATGTKAIEYARQHPVHVAILDIRMADCSGIDLLRMLKEIDPAIEVMMLTAYETLETARHALRLGACDYLSKPFDLHVIREAAGRALNLRRVSENIRGTGDRLRDLSNRLGSSALREEMARTTSEIYAGVLHDINNPLTVISGYVEVLEQRLNQASSLQGDELEEVRTHAATIAKQVNTCTAIAKRYLRFVHRSPGSGESLPVNQILDDVQTLLKSHPALRHGHLVVTPLELEGETQIDATDFIQILLNLTINAFQSGTEGQIVRIVAERIATPLALPLALDPETEIATGEEAFANVAPLLAISVIDQGSGIAPAHLSRIFDAYFSTKAQDGTGLGLAIVDRLVRTNHGLAHVKTQLGEGTTFTLYFPLKE